MTWVIGMKVCVVSKNFIFAIWKTIADLKLVKRLLLQNSAELKLLSRSLKFISYLSIRYIDVLLLLFDLLLVKHTATNFTDLAPPIPQNIYISHRYIKQILSSEKPEQNPRQKHRKKVKKENSNL